MDDFTLLRRHMTAWDGRRRRQEILDWLPRVVSAAALLGLGLSVLTRLRPLLTRSETGWIAGLLILLASSLTLLVFIARRRSLAQTAQYADRRLALKERMATAVEINSGRLRVPADLATRQLSDAVAVADKVDVAQRWPLRVRWGEWLATALLLLLLLILLQLPNSQENVLLEQRAVAAAIDEQAAQLAALSEEIAANPSLTEAQREALQQPLESAFESLNESGLTREEAVATLSEAEAQLRSLGDTFDNNSLEAALSAAAAPLQNGDTTAEMGQALQSGDLSAAGRAAADLADTLPETDHGTQQDLAEALSETASALANTDSELAEQLNRAAEALRDGDTAAAQQALREAAATLQARAQEQAAAAQARQTATALGAGRQAIAQAGETGTEEATEAGDTAGAQSGASGTGGTEAAQPGGTGQGTGAAGQIDGGSGPGSGGGHTENVFVPAGPRLEGQGTELELDVQCLRDPEACGPLAAERPTDFRESAGGALVPYERVYGDYRDAAYEAIAGDEVPRRLQDLVRDYFTALQP